jgi:hypothetical protein
MPLFTTATFEDGVFRPDSELSLAPKSRVCLAIQPIVEKPDQDSAWDQLEKLWQEVHLCSEGELMTRDQLHERD